ncbi:MAG TPA: chemotaxis protein CheW [Acetobacteraceae bacterium]|jgi:two-component system chemotaxis sensor kinase CheA|nr:chemotaxis protein CheW [Acetobacteraceae bacterium]
MDDLLADFLTETNENLADLDVALLKLERTPDDRETLSLIFRLVHTIKGTCGFLGLPRLEHVAHAAENVLGKVRDGVLTATPDTVSLVLTALDRVKAILAGLSATGAEPAGDDSELVDALNAAASGQAPVASPVEPPAPAEAEEPPSPPAAEAVEPAPRAAPPQAAAPEPAPGEPIAATQTIRVTVDVLEDLMTLVSELVLTRNQLLQLARTQENNGFTVPLQRLSHITSDLQEGVMKTRMQPIGIAWNKLPRLVRDVARDMGKKIELIMLGADTELDRQVLELIKDPLTHMVRNSGDHGLETPAERRAAGKPETGHITLNAYHEGGHIIIEIADDGRGLPLDRIRAKVLGNGLATEAELNAMTEAQLQRFIFRPGFSTASVVTAVSGRGVGMDVVKTNIEKIGGTIDLKTTPGSGTTFIIKIPLTLAIVSALIVEAGKERFAIPQISVVELVRAQKEASRGHNEAGGSESVIERINDTPVLRLRDRLLPLVNLNDLLDLGDSHNDDSGAYIVVAQVGANILGIIVDRVFDTEEIVVKPVAPILRHVTMFSGNTILGDGSVIMILDPNGIARATGIGASGDSKAVSANAKEQARSSDLTAMLLFRAGNEQKMAVPLGLVARLEDIPRDKIEISCGAPVTQYRGKLMPLVALSGNLDAEKPRQSVLVFNDGDRSMGLMVDEIVDVIEDRLNIELSGARPGLLGTAVIGGHATDVIDTGYWLMQAWQDWFHGAAQSSDREKTRRVLVVEDSDFFRQLLTPILGAAGYRVTAASSAAEALRLREGGAMFDVIVSDIVMPDMDGLDFARSVRAGGPWTALPMIALSSQADPHDVEAGRDAGFTDYVAKFQRDALIASLQQCLAEPIAAA